MLMVTLKKIRKATDSLAYPSSRYDDEMLTWRPKLFLVWGAQSMLPVENQCRYHGLTTPSAPFTH
jgi:hypothetical protein